ncbi:MAG: ABC transporter permease [Fusobacteria bacterium]|nr:MAG: ABC transporter permease [Fusobacteriota bacterium]
MKNKKEDKKFFVNVLLPYLKYIGNRLLHLLPVVIIISIVIFTLINLMPGDPVLAMINPETTANMSEEQRQGYIEAMRKILGYDKSVFVRYFIWWKDILTGNFGYSVALNKPVNEFIGTYIMNSFKVNIFGFVLAFLIAIPIGIKSAVKKNSRYDKVVTVMSMIGISIPSFFLALLLVLFFSAILKVLPFSGMTDPRGVRPDYLYYILPISVIVLSSLASLIRYIRNAMIEVLKADYIRTSRAKGLSEKVVIYRHAFKNALIPVITIIGFWIPGLFGGSIIVEKIFAWPGMGLLMNQAYAFKDRGVLSTVLLFFAVLTLFANLFVDVGYALVDPRIKARRIK